MASENRRKPEYEDPPLLVQRALVEQEIQLYVNTRYQQTMRYQVCVHLKDEAQAKQIQESLVGIESALDWLHKKLESLPTPPEKNSIHEVKAASGS